jgi:hypothetical protein
VNVYDINAAYLSREFGVTVPDEFIVIAKHQVLGLDNQQIADTMGCEVEDLIAAEADETYRRVKEFIAQVNAQQQQKQTEGWDAIESIAMEGLLKRLPHEKDSEFLLKAATLANRATRRMGQQSNVLDPGLRAGTRTITLTQRLVSKITSRGDQVQEQTRQVSITDGTASNPNFDEIDSLLSVRHAPVLPHAVEIRTHNADPTQDELIEHLMENK